MGYTSDLSSNSEWAQKEFDRMRSAATEARKSLDCVDRLFVLDRGIINPTKPAGIWEADSADSVFLNCYLHVVNFLARESERREPVDWQIYGPRHTRGWKPLI